MELEHAFTVPVDVPTAWEVLLDVERIAPCLPGASIESVEGDSFTGQVKVKVGPITVAYAGSASFTEKDSDARRAVLQAKGKETRGAGTAAATVTATLHEDDDGTRVVVHSDLAITGRPAQFGRGVMDDVGAKLLGQFADCLAVQLTSAASATEAADAAEPSPTQPAEPSTPPPRPTPDAINVVSVAGGSVLRRAAGPILIIIVLIIILIIVL